MSNRPYLDQMEVDGVTYDLRAANGTPLIEGYGGNDLSEEFASAEALHTAIAAGDFSKIHIGDYFPVTLNGSYKDYARFTVPSGTTYYTDAALTTEGGTTEADAEGEYQSATAIKFKVSGTDVYASISDCTAGFTKSMNANVKLEVAAINPYLRFGDTELTAQHILLCSRDCLPPTLQYRCNNSVWYDTSQVNPWLGSALYETLNNAENGIIKLVEATSLGAYIFKGPNNKGMRAYLETMAAGAASPTAGAWADRGRLFLPEEMEVYGSKIRSPKSNAIADMLYNQWPIFTGTGRHIIKGAGDGGGRSYWWLETADSATYFCVVHTNGYADYYTSANTRIRVPLCFLLA